MHIPLKKKGRESFPNAFQKVIDPTADGKLCVVVLWRGKLFVHLQKVLKVQMGMVPPRRFGKEMPCSRENIPEVP